MFFPMETNIQFREMVQQKVLLIMCRFAVSIHFFSLTSNGNTSRTVRRLKWGTVHKRFSLISIKFRIWCWLNCFVMDYSAGNWLLNAYSWMEHEILFWTQNFIISLFQLYLFSKYRSWLLNWALTSPAWKRKNTGKLDIRRGWTNSCCGRFNIRNTL